MRAWTGIIPQPYVTRLTMAFRSRHCSGGTVTKCHGAGPRQYQILPLNSIFMGTVYQIPSCCQPRPGAALLTRWRINGQVPDSFVLVAPGVSPDGDIIGFSKKGNYPSSRCFTR